MSKVIKFRRSHFLDPECKVYHNHDYWGKNVGMYGHADFTSPSTNNTALYFIDDQFTGLKDKNEVEIYEGDIVRYIFNKTNVESFQKFIVTWDEIELKYKGIIQSFKYSIEVIGNIHKNPELLSLSGFVE